MTAFIHRLETLVPPYAGTQETLGSRLADWARDPATARIIQYVFNRSGIKRRHSVVPDFTDAAPAKLFRTDAQGALVEPTTQERNRCFAEAAGPMAVELARRLVDGQAGFTAAEVTHVITVSCTGFVNPGPDWRVVTELGLAPTVERYNLGFMGCYAALPALRMAQQFCAARPDAVVLVICVELCSLHMQMKSDSDSILANALFSDGAAAALVSAQPPRGEHPVLALDHFMSAMAPEAQRDMAWEIGDHGFNLVLSTYVPDVIGANVSQIVNDLLEPQQLAVNDVNLWAVHPGGKAILDKVERSLELAPALLRDFGNMSSATILFVLQRLMEQAAHEEQVIGAMAFGPGLTIECGLLRLVPATAIEQLATRNANLEVAVL
jgi:predicted naringenin-chalcone synthase